MMGDSELAAMRRRIVECSQADGRELAAIYIERVETTPFAWQALREKLTDSSGLNVVIVSAYTTSQASATQSRCEISFWKPASTYS